MRLDTKNWLHRLHRMLLPSSARQNFRHMESGSCVQVAFVTDTSFSMTEDGGKEDMMRAFSKILAEIRRNPAVRSMVQMSLLHFGRGKRCEYMFQNLPIAECKLKTLPESTSTFLYESYASIVSATLEQKKWLRHGKKRQCDVVGSIIIVLSDYQALDQDAARFRELALAAKDTATENQISILNVACGSNVRMDIAQELSQPGRDPIWMQATADFGDKFPSWLVDSIRITSVSQGQRRRLTEINGKKPWVN